MRINVGILVFGDPTRGGTIASEVKFLGSLYEHNRDACDFYILTVNESVTKRIQREKLTTYNFPHEIVTIFGEEDFHKLSNFSCIVTYPGHSNFFGGYLNDNIIKMYKIVSHCTNNLDVPVFVRINDSEIKVRDYRKLSEQRLLAGYQSREDGKPDNAFMKDPKNVEKAENLVSWKEWNYLKIFWFANGSRESNDWVAETLFDREDEVYRMAARKNFVLNTIYVSDDIFFLVRKNYDRFSKRYTRQFQNLAVEEKLCYIGFFDTVNMARARALNTLFKENVHKIPVKIFGKGTEILDKLKKKENFDVEEGFIKGDSEEYFDFLNNYLAYIFIGKGQSESRYIGKTVYDAVVARTPVIVYKKCDSKMITFSNAEFYFEDERELKIIFEKLKDSKTRDRWIDEQAADIFKKLPPSKFLFFDYSVAKNSVPEDIFYSPHVKQITSNSIKSTALF